MASVMKELIEKMSFCRFSVNSHWISLDIITFNLDEEICRAYFNKYSQSYFPTTQINGFSYTVSEEAVPSFLSYSYSEHFRKHRWKSPYFRVLGKLPPGWFQADNPHPENSHLEKFPPRITPTRTIPTRKIPTQDNYHPENSHPDYSNP